MWEQGVDICGHCVDNACTVDNVYTMCRQCVYIVDIVCRQHVYNVYTMCIHCVYTVCVDNVQPVCKEWLKQCVYNLETMWTQYLDTV